jgi:starch-binding outer membrane protein, SusD/RagB family
MKNHYGNFLFPQTADPSKWDLAAAAAKEVIDLGAYQLYKTTTGDTPFMQAINSYSGIFFELWNDELIFARWDGDGYSWGVRAAPPMVLKEGYGGYAPSIKLVDTYPMGESGRYPITGYKSNGTPIVDELSGYQEDGFVDNYTHPIDGSQIKAHHSVIGRDARFYASILWNGMNWINTFNGTKLVTFYDGGTSSFNNKTGDFVKVGYMFRRMSDPRNDTENGKWGKFSWPFFRLAEIYLNYAEACNEMTNRNEAEALLYFNKVRNRSGLNNIEVAYPEIIGNQALFRELLRKERMVELAFENHRYYDIRTWMIAPQESNGPRFGRELRAKNFEDSWKRTSEICSPIVFEPKHYFFPIHQNQLNEMKNITQNYGW